MNFETLIEDIVDIFTSKTMLRAVAVGASVSVCAALLGVIAAGYGRDSRVAEEAERYADGIGLAFQVVDDILDATATAETLGKSVGGDAERNKTTCLSYYSVDGAWEYAREITDGAVRGIESWRSPDTLRDLAYYLLNRKN